MKNLEKFLIFFGVFVIIFGVFVSFDFNLTGNIIYGSINESEISQNSVNKSLGDDNFTINKNLLVIIGSIVFIIVLILFLIWFFILNSNNSKKNLHKKDNKNLINDYLKKIN